jgi:hypothetical protein
MGPTHLCGAPRVLLSDLPAGLRGLVWTSLDWPGPGWTDKDNVEASNHRKVATETIPSDLRLGLPGGILPVNP